MSAESHYQPNSYDEVAYPGRAHPQTHPDLLGTLGRFFGMQTVAVERCRVLEIGCGDGTNCISMAYGLPGSRFLGIDIAETPIARGCDFIRQLGLSNIALSRQDLMDFALDAGPFDYIIAHGFYSWVPPQVRDRMMEVCRDALSLNGIAFVSYNCYPGGFVRRMTREMMRFHIQRAPDPAAKIEQAQDFLRFLAEEAIQDDEYRQMLKREWAMVRQRDAHVFYHDDLADTNQPVYFHEFVEHAGRYGLQFLAEVPYSMMQDGDLTRPARQALGGLNADRVMREQYLDFLRLRSFRQTLLCHQEISLLSRPAPEVILHLRAASSAQPVEVEAGSGPVAAVTYRSEAGRVMVCGDSASQTIMRVLTAAWPHSMPFCDLTERVGAAIPAASAEEKEILTTKALMRAYGLGMVDLGMHEPRLAWEAANRPVCSPIARLQAPEKAIVTSLRHAPVNLQDKTIRRLLPLMDGTLDCRELAYRLQQIDPHAESIELILGRLCRLALLLPSPE